MLNGRGWYPEVPETVSWISCASLPDSDEPFPENQGDDGYSTYYVEASIQYRAMFDHKNTTELNIMGDEVVAATPVEHTHEYQDVNSFSLQAYSLAEIFTEKLRTIYQRSRGRDYYDLYQIVIGDETPPAETVAAMFDAKRAHAPDESYHTPPEPSEGLPVAAVGSIADDWETTIPELVEDPGTGDGPEATRRVSRREARTSARRMRQETAPTTGLERSIHSGSSTTSPTPRSRISRIIESSWLSTNLRPTTVMMIPAGSRWCRECD